MCLICVDFQKQKMTILDAKRAFREMVVDMDPNHAKEVREMIQEAEKAALTAKKEAAKTPDPQDP